MRATVSWQDAPPDRDGLRSVCYDVAYKPDGSQLVTGMGNRVLVYGCQDGALLHSLKAHKDAVYACLLYTSPSPRDATLSRMPSSA